MFSSRLMRSLLPETCNYLPQRQNTMPLHYAHPAGLHPATLSSWPANKAAARQEAQKLMARSDRRR
jgi:hypothetical protein